MSATLATSKRRPGFTLVELLVVVLIITILATIVLFAMFASAEAARAARTRSMIARINDLLLPRWESYRTRRVPIAMPIGTDRTVAAQTRVDALRELMRMELPDRKSDVEDAPVTIPNRPALSSAYQRFVQAHASGGNYAGWSNANQGSECLYMILSRTQDGNTNGLEFARESEIGDVDGDGMPEILDGWGKPIAFLRWAPGFIPSNNGNSALQDGSEPDPFDPLQVRGGYYLFPLVFSAGPDREYHVKADNATALQYSTTTPPNDPYTTDASPLIGTPDASGGNFVDNIHNHLNTTGT